MSLQPVGPFSQSQSMMIWQSYFDSHLQVARGNMEANLNFLEKLKVLEEPKVLEEEELQLVMALRKSEAKEKEAKVRPLEGTMMRRRGS